MMQKLKILLTGCLFFLLPFRSIAQSLSVPDYLSVVRADSLIHTLVYDLPTNRAVWYSAVDFLRSQHFILDYYKRSNALANDVGTFVDSLAFTDVGVGSKGRIVMGSWVKKVRLTATSPVITDNLAVTIYMETSDLTVYQNWLKEIEPFPRVRIKSQITPFDETWGIVENLPKFQYYFITYKILNNYFLNTAQITSNKPLMYSVLLQRYYKP